MQENDPINTIDDAVQSIVDNIESQKDDVTEEDTEQDKKGVSEEETNLEDHDPVQPEDDTILSEEEDQKENADNEELKSDESEEQNFTLTIDGKEQDISEKELLDGYLRQEDYTKKSQVLADERREFQDKQEAFNNDINNINTKVAEQIALSKIVNKKTFDLIEKNGGYLDPEEFEKEQKFIIRDAQYELEEQILAQQKKIESDRANFVEKEINIFYSNNPDYQGTEKEEGLKKFITDHNLSNLDISAPVLEVLRMAYEGQNLQNKVNNAKISLKKKQSSKDIPKFQKSSSTITYKPRKKSLSELIDKYGGNVDQAIDKYVKQQ
jgi:hypothetical protein